jgi:two-component system, OmpR family, KDP operon response regulator KdpE
MTGSRVLLVEDEAPMRRFLYDLLSTSGYQVDEAQNGEQAVALAAQAPPDLMILDLGLPDMDGQDLLRRMRAWLRAPIIILSVRNQDGEKVAALDHGANDYLTKPFSPQELLARIRAAMRQSAVVEGGSSLRVWKCGDLEVDFVTRKVLLRGTEVSLTPIEYKLLIILVRHAGRVLTHQYLIQEVWGADREISAEHLRVFMANLRRKIEVNAGQPRHLLTQRGVGYRMASE